MSLQAPVNLKLNSATRLKSENGSGTSEFIKFSASMRLPLAPVWMADGNGVSGGENGSGGIEGVRQVLAGWVMRYLPPLQCVLLSFSPTPNFNHSVQSFDSSISPFPPTSGSTNFTSLLKDDSPANDDTQEDDEKVKIKVLPMIEGSGFALPIVQFQGLGWRPRVGQKILGSPTLSTPSHVSLLIHNLFNATLPSSHIPSDEWEFDSEFILPDFIKDRQKLEFPTANLPIPTLSEEEKKDSEAKERGGADQGSGDEGGEPAEEEEEEREEEREAREEIEEEEQYSERGWWVNRKTGEPVGGKDGVVEFTIVSLTIANSMITITGSLLADPFSSSIPTQNTLRVSTKNGLTLDAFRRDANEVHNKKRKALAHELGEDDDLNSNSDDEDEEGGNGSESSRSPSPVAKIPTVKEESGKEARKSDDKDATRKEEKRLRKEEKRRNKEEKKSNKKAKKA